MNTSMKITEQINKENNTLIEIEIDLTLKRARLKQKIANLYPCGWADKLLVAKVSGYTRRINRLRKVIGETK